MTPTRTFLSSLAVTLLVSSGCGRASQDTASQDAASTLASSRDITAANCEVFIDKVRLGRSSHGYLGARLYVKVLRDRLDGDVAKVAFYARHEFKDYYGGTIHEDWRAFEGQGFLGASDYFEISSNVYSSLQLSGDYSSGNLWEGAVYVETVNGTRYWANPAGGGNFQLTRDSIDAVADNAYAHMYDFARVEATADALPYFNPQRCR